MERLCYWKIKQRKSNTKTWQSTKKERFEEKRKRSKSTFSKNKK